jgi:predicted transposase/invertase (TIGR01784 family)
MNFTPEEREAYEDRLKWLRIEANTIRNYEQRGEARGREEGIQIGEARGREEGKIAIAKNLLRAGLSIEIISQSTGLSKEQIESLKL